MAAMTTAIELTNLTKTYGGRVVLREVHLEVPAGQFVLLTGPNGSGKTTLLHCMAAMLRPTSGEVRWFGMPTRDSRANRHMIGMLPHQNGLYTHLTLRENLVFAARMFGLKNPGDLAATWLKRLGLVSCSAWFPSEASQGLLRRVAIARALIHDPPILLLDEPFAHLDTTAVSWLTDLLRLLVRRGCTICLATHEERKTAGFGARHLQLRTGALSDVVGERDGGSAGQHMSMRVA